MMAMDTTQTVLVDVRSPAEFASGHVQGAVNLPLDRLASDAMAVLQADEPAPLGSGLGPSPVQLLAAAVGNCLSDSLLFALRKFKQAPEPLHCTITAEVGRNAEKRLRVLKMTAVLRLGVPASTLEHLDRVLDQFEA